MPVQAPFLLLLGKQRPNINIPNINPINIPLTDDVSWMMLSVLAVRNAIAMKIAPQRKAAIESF